MILLRYEVITGKLRLVRVDRAGREVLLQRGQLSRYHATALGRSRSFD